MIELVYCHYCRTSHAREEMRLLSTKTGKRWRCLRSLEAVAAKDRAARDAYGRRVTENNKAAASFKSRGLCPPRRRRTKASGALLASG